MTAKPYVIPLDPSDAHAFALCKDKITSSDSVQVFTLTDETTSSDSVHENVARKYQQSLIYLERLEREKLLLTETYERALANDQALINKHTDSLRQIHTLVSSLSLNALETLPTIQTRPHREFRRTPVSSKVIRPRNPR